MLVAASCKRVQAAVGLTQGEAVGRDQLPDARQRQAVTVGDGTQSLAGAGRGGEQQFIIVAAREQAIAGEGLVHACFDERRQR